MIASTTDPQLLGLPVVPPVQGFLPMLAIGGVVAALTTYPYVATAIAYRHSDNGLAFILCVLGVGIWNGMSAGQLLSPEPLVTEFFYSLSIVGASLAGLGWFLFASTAESTPRIPRARLMYGIAAVLTGLNIVLAVTSPVHGLYWTHPPDPTTAVTYAVVVPSLGYWLHTQLLVGLFGTGTLLFATAWEGGANIRYTRVYAIAGTATVMALIGSNVVSPGGLSVAPLVVTSLTTGGWIQANGGLNLEELRLYFSAGE